MIFTDRIIHIFALVNITNMKNLINETISVLMVLFILALNIGCSPPKKPPMKIAVTKATKNYINWLKKGDSTLILVNMYPVDIDSALEQLDLCAGLLVTGGEDVQPEYYGKSGDKYLCTEMDPHRDTLEIALIKKAIGMKMPVLGICRGEQILNVTLGGTLIVDIPAHFEQLPRIYHITHQCEDYLSCFHFVHILPNTLLRSIVGCDTGFVNTNHHQAADMLAPGLLCNARSTDGLTEGIEWEACQDKSFLIGVQWHPERMDTSNALSGKLLREFILRSREFEQKK
jgi:putative glutamine amidotransferase